MKKLADQSFVLRKKMRVFDDDLSDYQIAVTHTVQLVSLIEEMESFAANCRKTIAGYYKDIPEYTGLDGTVSKTSERKFLYEINKNVTVSVEDNIFKLTLFPLIKNLSAKTKAYLTLIITDAVKQYFCSHKKPDFANKNCVLVVNSLYAKPSQVGDNDHIEVAAIINALKHLLLTDDDGISLSIYRMGSLSERHETEIYLMEEHDFMVWFLSVVGTKIV